MRRFCSKSLCALLRFSCCGPCCLLVPLLLIRQDKSVSCEESALLLLNFTWANVKGKRPFERAGCHLKHAAVKALCGPCRFPQFGATSKGPVQPGSRSGRRSGPHPSFLKTPVSSSAMFLPAMALFVTLTCTSNASSKPDGFFLKMRVTNLFCICFITFLLLKFPNTTTVKSTVNSMYYHPASVISTFAIFEGTNLIIFASDELCKRSRCGCSLQVHILSLDSTSASSMSCVS